MLLSVTFDYVLLSKVGMCQEIEIAIDEIVVTPAHYRRRISLEL